MTVQVWEAADSEDAKSAKDVSGNKRYFVSGSFDRNDAIEAVAAAAPLFLEVGNAYAIRSSIDPKELPSADGMWDVKVSYVDEDDEKSEEDPEEGTWQFSFDTTGGDHEITQSLSTVERYYRTTGNRAPDLKGAIGWDGKKLNGTKIVIPKLEFQLDVYYDSASVDTIFAANLSRATGKVCDDEDGWLGFEAGEVLFLGSTGSGDKPTRYGQRVKPAKVTFKFACSENRTDITIGELALKSGDAAAAAISKKGWEYLWVYYTKKDTVDGIVYPTPEWAYVEKVYREMTFGDFFGVR